MWGEAGGYLSFHPRLSYASEPRTLMSCNSTLESQTFVKRAPTGNRLLSTDHSICEDKSRYYCNWVTCSHYSSSHPIRVVFE